MTRLGGLNKDLIQHSDRGSTYASIAINECFHRLKSSKVSALKVTVTTMQQWNPSTAGIKPLQ